VPHDVHNEVGVGGNVGEHGAAGVPRHYEMLPIFFWASRSSR
jgi:hypothetical protein